MLDAAAKQMIESNCNVEFHVKSLQVYIQDLCMDLFTK